MKEEELIIDLERDGLFDDLGLTRLRESYMREEEGSHKKGSPTFVKSLAQTLNTPSGSTTTLVSTGCPCPRLSSVMGEVIEDCPYHASCPTLMTVQTALSRLSQK